MAKKRQLTEDHKKKISQAMKKRHSIQKGVAQGDFGAQAAEYNMNYAAYRSISKSFGPDQAYQLSIDVRSAVNAISSNIAKMNIRLFNARSGKEIIAGDLYDFFKRPSPRYTQSRWLSEIAAYYALQNEVALLRDPGTSTPKYLMPLNPTKLQIEDPTVVRDLAQVTRWRYFWEDGLMGSYAASQICFDKLFNPVSQVRGISPILTGSNEIGSSYEGARYNKQFFENGAVPSHMLILPEGTPRQTRQDIENRYLATFGIGDGNAHKVMVVSGGDVKVQELSQQTKDAQFVNLINMNTQRIAQLFKVPAIEMGIYDKTRFETAAQEREMFFEGTLMPLADRISDFLQDQVVDRWFGSSSQKTIESNLTKSQKARVNKAIDSSFSDIVVLLDAETTPIAAKIMRDKVAVTKELRLSAGLSFNEAASYVGLDLPEPLDEPKTFRDIVFIPSGETRIDHLLHQTNVQTETVQETVVDDTQRTTEESDVEVDKELVKELNSFMRKYRKLVVKAADAKDMYLLADVDELVDKEFNGCDITKMQMRIDYAFWKKEIEDGDVRGVKDKFNTKDRTWIKNFAAKIYKQGNLK